MPIQNEVQGLTIIT